MKNVFLLSILCFVCIFSHAQNVENQLDDQGRKQGVWSTRFENGKLKYKGKFLDDKPIGEMFHYHRNGKIKSRLRYAEKSDTVSAKMFNDLGKLISTGNYLNTQKIGIWNQYKKGKLFAQSTYSSGVLEGEYYLYHGTGEVMIKGLYSSGEKEGVWSEYFIIGRKKTETTYRKGIRDGLFRSYTETGSTKIEGAYKQDVRHGAWRLYNGSKLLGELIYDNGFLKNPELLSEIKSDQFEQMNLQKLNTKDPQNYVNRPWEYAN